MTAHERIDAAIAARDKATPGPWKAELCLGGSYVIDNTLPETRGKVRRIAEVYGHLSTPSDARLIAAAPDLVDEVIRLRKWQEEALPYLNIALARLKPSHLDFIRFNDAIDDINRLIAEAKEVKE